MDSLDSYRNGLVDEVMMLSKRVGWSGEYIEKLPRLDRIHAMKVINKIIQQEKNELEKIKKK